MCVSATRLRREIELEEVLSLGRAKNIRCMALRRLKDFPAAASGKLCREGSGSSDMMTNVGPSSDPFKSLWPKLCKRGMKWEVEEYCQLLVVSGEQCTCCCRAGAFVLSLVLVYSHSQLLPSPLEFLLLFFPGSVGLPFAFFSTSNTASSSPYSLFYN